MLEKLLKKAKEEKGEDKLKNWIILMAFGVMLLLLGNGMFEKKETSGEGLKTEVLSAVREDDYETAMEKKLEEILTQVQGAGKVEVMITTSSGKEIVVADDVSKSEDTIQETDASGGTRTTKSYSEESKSVMYTPQSGKSEPLVLKELEPKVEGIIIVAEGGDNAIVESNLRKAAGALFDVPIYKIEVFKMK